ncbi:sulfurtransferase [Flavobacterium sp.]|uniref:sulfurtransferase n=1 Tax=Flavobacterium sp. TaxID=239 RepID=UPI001226A78E|nr:sulfurtransferase [Flavobacterium sp.]RZJ71019.1 MAG: sulfurtransferase [Flavobacterium sp.]
MALVSVEWLRKNSHDPKLVILDGSFGNPIEKSDSENKIIPNAIFFDLDKTFSDTTSDLPHTMVSEQKFTDEVQKLGIDDDSKIVVYDNKGIYASPRVWWMFRSMGFENVCVLDGGLPEWERVGFDVSDGHKTPGSKGNFVPEFNPDFFADKVQVKKAILENTSEIVDARHPNRFNGLEDEPRKGLRRGHIPSAKNLYFNDCLCDGKLKPTSELRQIFSKIDSEKPTIFSCGSGVTACITAFAAYICGFEKLSVYDGSWAEWGSFC